MHMMVSVIVPVYNEEKTITATIREIYAVAVPKQVVVVDDGSTDGTTMILKKLNSRYPFALVQHKNNLGKGAAIKTAIKHIEGDVTVIQDADLEIKPKNYPRLIQPILNEQADVVLTYRLRTLSDSKPFMYKVYFWGSILQTFLTNLLFNARIKDVNSGCKVLKSEILRALSLESDGFEIEQEIIVKILKKRYTIKELPVEYFPRMTDEGKKIRILDGVRGLVTLFKYKLIN